MLTKTALLAIIPTGIALLAGAALPFQAASDAVIGLEPGHPLSGALVWLAGGRDRDGDDRRRARAVCALSVRNRDHGERRHESAPPRRDDGDRAVPAIEFLDGLPPKVAAEIHAVVIVGAARTWIQHRIAPALEQAREDESAAHRRIRSARHREVRPWRRPFAPRSSREFRERPEGGAA